MWGILVLRAGYLQFLPHEKLQKLQNRQFHTVVNLQARRGAIIDRNGRDLAMSQTVYSLYADPKIIENKKVAAKKLAKIIDQPFESIHQKIQDPQKRFVWIERMMTKEKADEIKKIQIRGISFVEEWKRIYPNDTLLAQTLGFVGGEGQGLEGIELQFDSILRGSDKKVTVRRDARGRPLINDGLMFAENPDGSEIKLTIDSELQYMLESELQSTVNEFNAADAEGIILDVQTSEILAIASLPSFDINNPQKYSASHRRNRVVTDVFEPGSTLKTFVLASAIKEKVFTPDSKIFCEYGQFKVGDKIIREAESHEKYAWMTLKQILQVSSNVGTSKIALKMGDDRLRQGLQEFGFSSKLGVDLPGEAKGIVQALPWKPHLLANISFGHGIAATPLQIANAYAAVANGGMLNTPYIISEIHHVEKNEKVVNEPKPIRRVLTEAQASQIREMLLGVTQDGGTGVNARVNGFQVAGKTGTAQKVNPNGKGYLPGAYVSSFAGFIPYEKPKFVIYVVVDSPKNAYYGSQVAAPLFSRIASYAVRKAGLVPQILATKNVNEKNDNQKFVAKVIEFYKKKDIQKISAKEILNAPKNELTVVPELSRLTAREVIRQLQGKNIQLKFIGQGTVVETIPSSGSDFQENEATKQKSLTVILK